MQKHYQKLSENKFLAVAIGLSGCIAVIKGALAAHSYPSFMEDYSLQIIQTGLQFQMFHTLAAMAILALFTKTTSKLPKISVVLMLTGILFFTGSLYLLAFKDVLPSIVVSVAGPATPFGGLFFIGGWIAFVSAVLTGKKNTTLQS